MTELVVDTSALVSVLLGEPGCQAYEAALQTASKCYIAAPSWLEFHIVAMGKRPGARDDLSDWLELYGIQVMAFTPQMADLAADGYSAFGKGRHPAALNFGDCCAYATAKALALPLLYKGDDFSQTDVRSALSVAA